MNITSQTESQVLSGALSEIIEVKELSHPQDVNNHIKQGWKLLNTYAGDSIQEQPLVKYCMGWPKSAGALNMRRSVNSSSYTEKTSFSDRKKFIYSL